MDKIDKFILRHPSTLLLGISTEVIILFGIMGIISDFAICWDRYTIVSAILIGLWVYYIIRFVKENKKGI